MRKAQVSTEYLILAGVATIILIVILSNVSETVQINSREETASTVDDIGLFLQGEIATAVSVNDGYERVFTLPNKVNGIDYNITNSPDGIIISAGYLNKVFRTANYSGNITKGDNRILKSEGRIYLN